MVLRGLREVCVKFGLNRSMPSIVGKKGMTLQKRFAVTEFSVYLIYFKKFDVFGVLGIFYVLTIYFIGHKLCISKIW